jgi:phosphatidylinositol glycan class K
VAEEEVGSLLFALPHDGLLISSLRYNEIFFMIDTCQATTMYSKFYSPNILATGSSQLAENSYSVNNVPTNVRTELIPRHQYENDRDLGVSVIDTYTHYVLEYLEQINKTSQLTMQDLVRLENFLSLTQTD